MIQNGLSALAQMPSHYDFDVDEERVFYQFARKHLRRLELETRLKD